MMNQTNREAVLYLKRLFDCYTQEYLESADNQVFIDLDERIKFVAENGKAPITGRKFGATVWEVVE